VGRGVELETINAKDCTGVLSLNISKHFSAAFILWEEGQGKKGQKKGGITQGYESGGLRKGKGTGKWGLRNRVEEGWDRLHHSLNRVFGAAKFLFFPQ